MRHAGASGWPAVDLNAADVALDRCTVRDGATYGLDLSGNTYGAAVTDCSFLDNAWDAVYAVPFEALPGFLGNAASGNGRDIVHVFGDNNVDADLTVGPENLLGGVLVLSDNLGVLPNATLRVEAGVTVKMAASFFIDVQGGIELLGTAFEPVVVTSFEDDAHGGDSNADGSATVPAASDWRGLMLKSATMSSRLENVLLRHGGAAFYRGVTSTSPLATLRSVRVEHWGFTGFDLHAHTTAATGGEATNLVAFDCAGNGIELLGGSFQLHHATVAGCAGAGIARTPSFLGSVVSSISWDNAGGNYNGFAAGDLFASNGHPTLAGSDGNWNVDPLFVDPSPAVGDLHLSPGSICADTGSFPVGFEVQRDHDEHSRIAEYGNTGLLLPDMGAYELADWALGASGAAVAGTTLEFTVSGPPAAQALLAVGFLETSVWLPPFGFQLTVTAGSFFTGLFPVGQPFPLPVPDAPALYGLRFGVQAGVLSNLDPTHVGITNLYRGRIRP